eukprot:460343-Pyramimonas_sp.AAC.1
MLRRKLGDPKITSKEAQNLLMELRYNMWHIPASEMVIFLGRGKFPQHAIEMIPPTTAKCKICAGLRRTVAIPRSAGTILAVRFNHRVQTDIYTLWGC